MNSKNVVLELPSSTLFKNRKNKFFRVDADVIVDGKSLSEELIKRKLAFPYRGEKKLKRNWCL